MKAIATTSILFILLNFAAAQYPLVNGTCPELCNGTNLNPNDVKEVQVFPKIGSILLLKITGSRNLVPSGTNSTKIYGKS